MSPNDQSMGESLELSPRVTSQYSRSMYDEIIKLSDHIDFRHHRFNYKSKRSRSLGSVQAFIVELALTDKQFLIKLRKYMLNNGRGWSPTIHYRDRYD